MSETQQPQQAQNLLPGGDPLFQSMVAESLDAAGLPQEQAGAEEAKQEQAGPKKLWAGKYESPEEMEKGLLNLQRVLGSKGAQPEPEGAQPEGPYTLERATEIYGPTVAEAAARANLDLASWASMVEQGGDTSAQREALAKELGISPAVIEQYEQSFRPQADLGAEAEVSALKAIAGGEAGWQRLNDWAVENLSQAEISVINKALDDPSRAVAEYAVRSLVERANAQQAPVEPISGTPAGADVFATEEEAINARWAKDEKNRVKYEIDSKYREQYDNRLRRSKVFL